jgi:hypothetical protein
MGISTVQLGIAGHAGIGHTHCPGGLIQDDTLGFAVAGDIIRSELHAHTTVESVEVDVDGNTILVTTVGGGTALSSPRRGITPAEASMMERATGTDALLCQTTAIEVLGRMYGQGVLETPCALTAVLANAAVDTFRRKAPGRFSMSTEDLPGNSGRIGGLSMSVESAATSVMVTVNESSGGLGPNEDLEGNVALRSKRGLMEKLGMLMCPTIVLEGKAYNPALCDELTETTFLVRVQRDLDNVVVAEALRDAAADLGYPVIFCDESFPRDDGALRRRTIAVADAIAGAAERLKIAALGSEKVRAAAELARLVSQEVGGVSFMTDALYDVVRTTGLIPGTSAVLSMLVTRDYLSHWKVPVTKQEDVDRMVRVTRRAVAKLTDRLSEASDVLQRLYVDLAPLESLYR